MKAGILAAALLSLIPSLMAAEPPTGARRGELWALVLHSETGVGLEGIPVYAVSSDVDGAQAMCALTKGDGLAHFTGLPQGEYRVWVDYNNHQSEIATVVIDESLLGKVALFFNPDID